jgi:hypothetical protein
MMMMMMMMMMMVMVMRRVEGMATRNFRSHTHTDFSVSCLIIKPEY